MKELSDGQKAKEIIRIVRAEVGRSTSQYITAFGNLKKEEAESNMWDKQQEKDGTIDFSPYHVENKRKIMDNANEQKQYRDAILAYAINVFLDKIGEK